jgi:cytoskeletal protein RodZ
MGIICQGLIIGVSLGGAAILVLIFLIIIRLKRGQRFLKQAQTSTKSKSSEPALPEAREAQQTRPQEKPTSFTHTGLFHPIKTANSIDNILIYSLSDTAIY